MSKIVTIVLFFIYPLTGFSQVPNFEILEHLYKDAFDQTFATISMVDTNCVIQKPDVILEYSWLIEKQMLESLKRSGITRVFINNNPSGIENTLQVNYKPVSQTINYKKIKAKTIERRCEIELYLNIVDSQNKVLFADVLGKSFQDTTRKRDIKNVENVQLAYTHGQQEKTFFSKIYEPFIVSVITGLVIFLFYSYRSH